MTSKAQKKPKALALKDRAPSDSPASHHLLNAGEQSPLTTSTGLGSIKKPHDLSNLFFLMPTGRPDGVFQPLLCEVTGLLVNSGTAPSLIKEALLVYLGINSARLGYPMSLLLMPDDPLLAVGLLDRCTHLAPNGSVIEFQRITPEQIFIEGGAIFRNRCIISPDPKGFSKVVSDIELMLTRVTR